MILPKTTFSQSQPLLIFSPLIVFRVFKLFSHFLPPFPLECKLHKDSSFVHRIHPLRPAPAHGGWLLWTDLNPSKIHM